jgi:tRNA (mo5U34)-methyltransferase
VDEARFKPSPCGGRKAGTIAGIQEHPSHPVAPPIAEAVAHGGPGGDRSELLRSIGEIRWFHAIDLGNGIVTPGVARVERLDRMGVPERLDGRTVLDVGAWDGLWSFEAERRGAARVLATDSFVWDEASPYGKRGFDLAHRALRSNVESRPIDVMELSPHEIGTWDLVLFLGVLYHLRDPVTAIERVASVTGDQLILETETALPWCRHPAGLFFPGDELAHDPTNWWALNDRAIIGLLQRSGFGTVRRYSRTSLPRRLWQAKIHRWPPGQAGRVRTLLRCRRTVYHAWKA